MSLPDPTFPADELLDDLQTGRPAAWEVLVRRYGPLVLAIPRRAGLDEATCEDVFQATWLSVHRHLAALRRPDAFVAWLLTITHRHTWDVMRRRDLLRGGAPVEDASLPAPDEGDPVRSVLLGERQVAVRAAVSELPDRCRRLIEVLFGPAGVSYEEAARRLGMPVGSVGPTRLRCLARLARILERDGWP